MNVLFRSQDVGHQNLPTGPAAQQAYSMDPTMMNPGGVAVRGGFRGVPRGGMVAPGVRGGFTARGMYAAGRGRGGTSTPFFSFLLL